MRSYQKINLFALISTLVFISLIIRFLFFFFILDGGSKSWILVDSDHYHQMALSIIQGNYNTPLSFLRLPGFPAFLASCYQLLGNSPVYALITQTIIASFIPVLMYLLTNTIFPGNTLLAVCSAVYSCFHLSFVLYAGMLSTETLFLIFLLLFFIFFFKDKPNLIIAGLLLGTCSLIRPVGHFMLVISCITLLFRRPAQIFTLIGSWLLIVAPWLLRNYLLTGALFFHTLPGQHFLQYSATYVYQDIHNVSYVEARRALMDEFDKEMQSLHGEPNEIKRCKIAEKVAYKQLLKHPLLSVKHSLIHMIKSCIAPQSQLLIYLDSNWTYEPGSTFTEKIKNFIYPPVGNTLLLTVIYFDVVTHFLLWLGALLFMLTSLLRRQHRTIIFYACMFSGLFIAITLAYGSARLRLPIEPFLIIFAFKFLLDCYEMLKNL